MWISMYNCKFHIYTCLFNDLYRILNKTIIQKIVVVKLALKIKKYEVSGFSLHRFSEDFFF